jgi:hypothetical protein
MGRGSPPAREPEGTRQITLSQLAQPELAELLGALASKGLERIGRGTERRFWAENGETHLLRRLFRLVLAGMGRHRRESGNLSLSPQEIRIGFSNYAPPSPVLVTRRTYIHRLAGTVLSSMGVSDSNSSREV